MKKQRFILILVVLFLKKYFFFTLALLIIPTDVFSQTYHENYQNIAPNTPEITQFKKFIDHPVNEYTGIPNISIPLFNIESQGIELPIVLRYHAGGIKIDDMASHVGLGWDLTVGGVIIHQHVDKDDFINATRGDFGDNYEVSNDYIGAIHFKHHSNSEIFRYSDPYTLNIQEDKSPDLFSVNLLNENTSFILRPTLDMRSPNFWSTIQTKYLKNENKLKVITHLRDSHQIFSRAKSLVPAKEIDFFEAFDQLGNKYEFRDKSIAANNIFPGNDPSDWNIRLHTSSHNYHISKIENVDGHMAFRFSYDTDSLPTAKYWTLYQNNKSNKYGIIGQCEETRNQRGPNQILGRYNYTLHRKTLKRVDFNDGYLIFEYHHDRLDYAEAGTKALTKIYLYDSTSNLIKGYTFDYRYFTTPTCDTFDCYRLKLVSLTEFGKNTYTTLPPYFFRYNNSTSLPRRGHSLARDWWGYYNGNEPSELTATPAMYVYPDLGKEALNIFNLENVSGKKYTISGYNKNSVEHYAKAAMLEEIIYPSGGATKYEYELNEFKYKETVFRGSGLRIKKISSFSEYSGIEDLVKHYTYLDDSGVSSGNILNIPRFATLCGCIDLDDNSTTNTDIKNRLLFFMGNQNLEAEIQGSLVHYSKVKVDFGHGIVEKKFDVLTPLGSLSSYTESGCFGKNEKGYYSPLYDNYFGLGYHSGKLNQEMHYNKMGDLVFSKDYFWEKEISTIKYGNTLQFDDSINTFRTTFSKFHQSYVYLDEIDEKTYYGNEVVKKSNNYSHPSDSYLLTGFSTSQSNRGSIGQSIKYLNEFKNLDLSPSNSDELQAVITLAKKNAIELPIEHYKSAVALWGDSNKRVITEAYYYEYTLTPFPRRHKIFKLSKNKLTSAFVKSYVSDNAIIKDPDYELLYEITVVNDYGKPIEVRDKNNKFTTYLWGYNESKIIAKIENVSYSEVINALNTMGVNDLNTISESELKSTLNSLKLHLQNALITNYTHKPLIGVSTVTDPRGQTVYYEYDAFNRLENVKDAEGHILSKNEYHYKNQ